MTKQTTMRKYLLISAAALCMVAAPALSQEGCGEGEDYGAYIRGVESGPQGYSATNPGSTATGAYQFTLGTLQSMGYISHYSGPISQYFGAGNWDGVVWTGRDGIRSREQFMANHAAQDRALAELTQRNLRAVAGTYTPGQLVNGIPLTQGGVAAAVHMLGAGGFRRWAASGFSGSGLDPSIAAAHNWTPEQYNQHLMNRVAGGGCMDPADIEIGDDNIAELQQNFLMPFESRPGSPVILPGHLVSLL